MSRYVPTMAPPFARSKRNEPPTRASSLLTVILTPLGRNQRSNASGSIQARNTRWRDALNDRRSTRVLSSGTWGIIRVVLLFLQVRVQRVELHFPEVTVVFQP